MVDSVDETAVICGDDCWYENEDLADAVGFDLKLDCVYASSEEANRPSDDGIASDGVDDESEDDGEFEGDLPEFEELDAPPSNDPLSRKLTLDSSRVLKRGNKIQNRFNRLTPKQKRRARRAAQQGKDMARFINRTLPGMLKGKPSEQRKFAENPAKYLVLAGAPVPRARGKNGGSSKFENQLNKVFGGHGNEVGTQFWWLRCDICKIAVGAAVLTVAIAGALATAALVAALIYVLPITAAVAIPLLAKAGVKLGLRLTPNVIKALTQEVCVKNGKC